MTDTSDAGIERDGDHLDAEAEALVDRFNEAKPSYSPKLEWFGMSLDHDTGGECFVFEAAEYIDTDGLEALRDCGRTVRYIEAYEYDGEVKVQIELRGGAEFVREEMDR